MNPLPEEQVTFRIATNVRGKRAGEAAGGVAAQHAGRRAVEVRAASSLRDGHRMSCTQEHHSVKTVRWLP